jgi:hypothetical protein
VTIENFQSHKDGGFEKLWSSHFVVIEEFWLTSNCEGVSDGEQKNLVTFQHTHTFKW